MAKAIFDGFSHNEIGLDPYSHNPDVSEAIQQTTSMVQGWNEALATFKFIRADNVGRLLVSTAPPSAGFVSQTQFNVTDVISNILVANVNRRFVVVQNQGTNVLYLSYISPAALTICIRIGPGSIWTDELWSGDIFGLCTAGVTTFGAIWEY